MRPLVLVEDNESISEVLTEYLSGEGFVVHGVAETARRGLEILAELNELAVVLLDLVLPDASGEAFLDTLRSWGIDHRVIVISAAMPSRLAAARISPLVVEVFSKPFETSTLIQAIRRAAGD
jgi:DNA-binding NtrC family response regulator